MTKPSRRSTLLVLLAVVMLAIPAVALAARAKHGLYLQSSATGQVQLSVDRKADAITSFSTYCAVPNAQAGSILISKRIPISKKRKFSFTGKIKIGYGTSSIRGTAKITGSFTRSLKFAKGTFTGKTKTFGCHKVTFTAKYYGVNPQG